MIYEISKDVLNSHPRVFKYKIDNKEVYVKKREIGKKHIGHSLQKLIFLITRNPMLIPTVLSKNENEVLFEAEKIIQIAKVGVNVPKILYYCNDYFIMDDTGESLKEYIKSNINRKDYYIDKAISELSKLHSKGFAHGGSQIRNFTIKDEVISLIDFEENIPNKYIDNFKMRDLLVFILSLQKANFNPNVEKICEIYEGKSSFEVYKNLKIFLLKYKWIRFLKGRLFSKIRMKDVRDFMEIIDKIDKTN